MLKRIFWLSVIAVCGWLAWQWFRQRQSEFSDTAPQFAPARPYTPPTPPAAEPAVAVAPAAATPPPTTAPDTPEAPAAAEATHDTDELAAEAAPPAAEPATAEAPAAVAPAEASTDQEVVGYCMRCRTKRPIKGAHEEISESGRRAARGTCPVCGTNMFVFLATNDNEQGATQ